MPEGILPLILYHLPFYYAEALSLPLRKFSKPGRAANGKKTWWSRMLQADAQTGFPRTQLFIGGYGLPRLIRSDDPTRSVRCVSVA